MNSTDVIQAISAGICLYAGLVHLAVGLRSEPKDRLQLNFAMTALLFGAYSVNLIFLGAAVESGLKSHFVSIDKWGIALIYLAYASLFWLIATYTSARRRLVLWAFTSMYVAIAASNFVLPYTWVYTDIQLNSRLDPILALSPWYTLEGPLTGLLFVIYPAYHIVRQYRRGERAAARYLAIAVGIFAATYGWDILLVEYGIVDFILLQQYGFMAFIVIMSLRLSGQAVESAKEARQMSIELEQRVEQRTAELSKAKIEAEVASRAKSLFLTNMSHELRTPLNAILGHAQIMSRDQSLKPDQRHSVEAINRGGDHLLTLINSVLEMSKIEAGQAEVSLSSFHIVTLLNDMEMMFRDAAVEKGLRFEVRKGPETPHIIQGDRAKISQVLINLLSNALRHTHEGGLSLSAFVEAKSGDRRHLVLALEDTGEGIAAEEVQWIFDPFVQSGSTGPQQSGTGLGLAISREYALMMGGNLTVQSRAGQGSIFSLELPLAKVKSGPLEMDLSPPKRIAGIAGEKRDYRVLVADDESSNRDVLIRLLEPARFVMREAADGREALKLFESWSPHLVLMDIRMPTMDGKEAIKKIKATERGRATPVIGLSASAFEEDRFKVLESGADDFIAKPIQESGLWEKIGRLLEVEFLFEDEEVVLTPPSEWQEEFPPIKEHLGNLPEQLVAEMRAAVQGGYMERLAELAQRAAVIQPRLSRHLLTLVDQYDYETLSRLFLEIAEDKQSKGQ